MDVTVVVNNHEGIVVTDRAGGILHVNPAAASLLELDAREAVGTKFGYALEPGTVREIHLDRTADAAFIEMRVLDSFWEKKPAYLVSLRDVTQRKQEEKRLEMALEDLKFALASEKVLLEELDRKNKELIELSITDGLTGLYNHRFLQERFEFEFKRVKRYKTLLATMIIDIDHFKSVNDTYGHQIGDYVLREIAKILRSRSRDVDICGRYGGEEFMVITNLTAENAFKYASKLHNAIREHEFNIGKHSFHVTVSIGIADYRSDIRTRQEMIERADTALYKAKRDGRDLIRVWKEEEASSEHELDQTSITELKGKFSALTDRMRATYMESANALVKAVDAKDHYTEEHSKAVSELSVMLAGDLGLDDADIEVIKYAGLLHDIGKIGINHELLTKESGLSDVEFEMLKKHPMIAVSILKDVTFLEKELPIILHHHERYDGNGYPQGLKGPEIPLGARILAVIDTYVAMTTTRSFRSSSSSAEAIEELQKHKGTQFAPDIVDAFVTMIQKNGRHRSG